MVFEMLHGQIVETFIKLYDYVEGVEHMQSLMQFSTNTHVYTFGVDWRLGGSCGSWFIEGEENLCGFPILQIEEHTYKVPLDDEEGHFNEICKYSLTTAKGVCKIKVRCEEGERAELCLFKDLWLTYAKDDDPWSRTLAALDEEPPMCRALRRELQAEEWKWEQLVSVGREKSPY